MMIASILTHVVGWFLIVICCFPFLNLWVYVQAGPAAHQFREQNLFKHYFIARLIVISVFADLLLIFDPDKVVGLVVVSLFIEVCIAILAWFKLSNLESISSTRRRRVFVLGGMVQLGLTFFLIGIYKFF